MNEHDLTGERDRRGGRIARRLAALAVAGATVVGVAGSAGATGVPTHNHFLTTSSGNVVQVGPHVCSNPDLHDAFHNFHSNVHRGAPTEIGGLTITVTLC